jgi:hypothetical protein
MKTKALEVRDRNTFIPVVAIDMNPHHDNETYLLRRCGYPCNGRPNILLTRMDGNGARAPCDPYAWGDRTMLVAHVYIIEHWNMLRDGDVVDVQFINGETPEPKVSERFTAPY